MSYRIGLWLRRLEPLSEKNKLRLIVLSVDVALYILVILLLIWLADAPLNTGGHASHNTLDIISFAHESPSRAVPPIRLPSPITLKVVDTNHAKTQPSAQTAASSLKAASTLSCNLPSDIAQGVENDSVAMAEISTAPPSIKSETNSVMLWNGSWTVGDAAAISLINSGAKPRSGVAANTNTVVEAKADPLTHVRAIVEQRVATASQACQSAAMRGPQFISIRAGDQVFTIVIGSGDWHWRDLLTQTSTDNLAPCTNFFDRLFGRSCDQMQNNAADRIIF